MAGYAPAAMAYERGPEELPPDSPATVGELRRVRRLVAAAMLVAFVALAAAVLAFVLTEQKSSPRGASPSEVSDLEERIDRLDGRLERVSGGEEKLDERVADLERNQDANDTTEVEQNLERNRSQDADQEGRLESLEERLDSLEERPGARGRR